MRIPNFDVLDEALAIADEYKLGAMRDALGTLMTQKDSPVYINKDPIRAYGIATRRGLDLKAQEAARQTVGKVDFKRGYLLGELRKRGVSVESAFALAQKHFAWESALADVLLRSVEALILEEEEWKVLVCAECVSWKEVDGPAGLVEWQRNWIDRVYERLVCTPLDDCAYMFRPEYVARVWDEGCERCMIRLMRSQDPLDEWMARVWSRLQGEWEDIFRLFDVK
ncbi:hypothetical protein FRC07_012111 [Ceratobasidium sp. 392]|nr:hypothetical protein FRC07_012111 [Ceratobasidium sp. 392]